MNNWERLISGKNLGGGNLRRANLSGAELVAADLANADLTRADLRRANLSGALLVRAVAIRADFTGADLIGAEMNPIDLTKASLRRANLAGADMTGSELRGVDGFRADFTGVQLAGASLVKADLQGTDFRNANLRRADLSGANLTSADLRGVDLSRADLNRAILVSADLSGANLAGTDLHRADLSDSKVEGIYYDTRTRWPKGFEPPPPAGGPQPAAHFATRSSPIAASTPHRDTVPEVSPAPSAVALPPRSISAHQRAAMGMVSRTRQGASNGVAASDPPVARGSVIPDSELTREMNESQMAALRESLDALGDSSEGAVLDLTGTTAVTWSSETMSVAEAVERCGIAPSALRRALHQGRFPNAFRAATAESEGSGPWRIPVGDLIGAGFVYSASDPPLRVSPQPGTNDEQLPGGALAANGAPLG
ncbi:MAG: pentapeptide repeat-containing protein [Actinobacteria bacterium]|nr:pentapeptide repeat-containing protein [Actinomycetota bacterium]MCB9389018.1 pentapeptide repeat-containing protein [Acidimicrobiia bacterium]